MSTIEEETLREVGVQSRTLVTGSVDGSSAEAKRVILGDVGDVGEEAELGIYEAVKYLREVDLSSFGVSNLLELNARVVGRTLATSGLRRFDVGKYGYLPFSEIEAAMPEFVDRLRGYGAICSRAEAVDRLFDIHWSINLRGHYFLDACGRTATVLGCWISYACRGEVLRLPPRDQYLATASSQNSLEYWRDVLGG